MNEIEKKNPIDEIPKAKKDSNLENRYGDADFDRYSSDVGFGGPDAWYSKSDDSGGLYTPQESDSGPNAIERKDGDKEDGSKLPPETLPLIDQ